MKLCIGCNKSKEIGIAIPEGFICFACIFVCNKQPIIEKITQASAIYIADCLENEIGKVLNQVGKTGCSDGYM